MNLIDRPDLLDRLAASHALGTLRGGARRRFEALARQSDTVRVRALLWQERFASMTELQRVERPSPNVWKRISNELDAQQKAIPSTNVADTSLLDALRRHLGWWRGAAFAGGLATVAALLLTFNLGRQLETRNAQLALAAQQGTKLTADNASLTAQLQQKPEIQYVAVLSDEKAAASMLVTFDPKRNTLTLKRVGGFQEGADKSLELWALPAPQAGAGVAAGPRSLGVVGGGAVIKLTAAEASVRDVPALAISLEPKGGVPAGSGPTGPILFKGALIQTAL